MTTGMEHRQHGGDHEHRHGPDCAHERVQHADHYDEHGQDDAG